MYSFTQREKNQPQNSEGGIIVPSEGFFSFYLFTVAPLQSSLETVVIHQQPFNLGLFFPQDSKLCQIGPKPPISMVSYCLCSSVKNCQ